VRWRSSKLTRAVLNPTANSPSVSGCAIGVPDVLFAHTDVIGSVTVSIPHPPRVWMRIRTRA